MDVILTDTESGVKYRISPSSNMLSWQIYRQPVGILKDGKLMSKNGKEIKAEWTSMEKYPSTLYLAVLMVQEMIFKDSERMVEIEMSRDSGIDSFGSWLKEMAEAIVIDYDRELFNGNAARKDK